MLLLADPIDAFWPERMDEFEGKPSAASPRRGRLAGDKDAPMQPDISDLLAALKAALGDAVVDVRATGRLTDSAVVLSLPASGPDLQMQRLLRRAGRAVLPTAPVLEINPRHALIGALRRSWQTNTQIAEAAGTLLDLARVQEGDLPRDPAEFARRVTSLLGLRLVDNARGLW